MSKNFYCARCGKKLKVIPKAIPQKGIIMNLVEPHVCEETSFSNLDEEVQPKEVSTKGAFGILDKENKEKLLSYLKTEGTPFVWDGYKQTSMRVEDEREVLNADS